MANSFKIRYLTNREKLNTFDKLHKDRHIYLGLNEAEPSLGYVGERPLPSGVTTYYSLVTIDNGTIYDRYWKELGLRIEDEGTPVGVGNNINIINFVGAAITVIETSSNSVDIKVFAPGLDNQIIFNNNEELTAAPQFYYDSNTNKVGIGSTLPQQHLDIIGNLKISNNIYDSKNVVGSAGSVIVSTNGNGIVWGRGAPVSIGTIPHTGAVPGELWWNKRTGNLNVYYDDGNSQQWVDANSGFGVQGTSGIQGPAGGEPNYWNFGELGISTTKNVGIGTTNPTSKLFVVGDAYISGVLTATSGYLSKLHVLDNVLVSGVTTISGNLNAPGNYYAKLVRTTDQTALNGTDTLIGFSVIADPNNWYSGITTRTTPTVAGTYHVDLMVNWLEGTITNNQTNIQIRKNGNTFAISLVGIHTFSYTMNACGIVTMNGTTDYIDATVYTSNPTSQVVRGTADGSWTKMEIFKIN